MISRVADHCFWLGRYIERAESSARLLQVTRTLAFDAELPPLFCWRPLVIVSGQYPEFSANLGADAAGNGEVVQRYMTWAPENPVSIRNSIRAAREGARSIREVIGHDIWEATNELFLWFMGEEAASQYQQDRDAVYRQIRRSTQLCLGLVRSTMLHDAPMDFLWLGVLLERVGQTARTLDMHHHIQGAGAGEGQQPLLQTALWLSLLRACSGFEAYMRRNQGRVSRDSTVSFLLFEARFPRSLRYCLRSAIALSKRLVVPNQRGGVAVALDRLEALDLWLDEQEKAGVPLSVHALLTHVVDEACAACGDLQGGLEGAAPLPDRRPEAAQ
jgi:uncharacterized alpha-E superfamily protein